MRLYQLAAEQGFAQAQSNLGVMYANSQGVPQDYTEAAKWYRKAAEQGHVDALYYFGMQSASGQGIPQDYVTAHVCFNIASARGHDEARHAREKLERDMMPGQLAEAQRLSRTWSAVFQR